MSQQRLIKSDGVTKKRADMKGFRRDKHARGF